MTISDAGEWGTRTDEIDLSAAGAYLEDAERALDGLRDRVDDQAMDDDCDEIGYALDAMGVVLAELHRRRIQVDALVGALTRLSDKGLLPEVPW